MTGIMILLYAAIGIGCGLIRLSAIAVGIIAMIPAVVGAVAVIDDGFAAIALAILTPLLAIECVYFLTMLAVARLSSARPAQPDRDARKPAAGDVPLRRKSQLGEEP